MARKKNASIEPTLAQKMQHLLEQEGASLQQVLDALGLKAVARGADEKPLSRVATQRAWLDATKQLDEEEALAIKSIPEVISTGLSLEAGKQPTQEHIDSWCKELKPLRKTEDVIKGRCNAIRLFAFNGFDAKFGEDEPGKFVSTREGMKLERVIAETKPQADLAKLQEVVDEQTWKKITRTERVVDEDKLTKALSKGLVTLEQMSQIVEPAKKIERFNVKPLKPGDEIE